MSAARVSPADELVVTVSAEGLAPGDGCPVAAADQFELNWFKHHDLAMIKLKRTAPKECVSGLRGTPKGAAEGVELRVPLPEELKHGTAHGDFSRMLLGLPPGGVFESYLLFDNSALTNTAAKWKATEAADEAAAAAEKLELFPEAATEGAEELAGNDGEGDDSAGERAAAGAAAGEASAGTAAA